MNQGPLRGQIAIFCAVHDRRWLARRFPGQGMNLTTVLHQLCSASPSGSGEAQRRQEPKLVALRAPLLELELAWGAGRALPLAPPVAGVDRDYAEAMISGERVRIGPWQSQPVGAVRFFLWPIAMAPAP